MILIQSPSAAAERMFSLFRATFSEQQLSLHDYVETTIILEL